MKAKENILPIGTKIVKKSGKPFKSGEKVGTVVGVILHPQLPEWHAYLLREDDSYVRVSYCEEYNPKG